MIDDLLIINDTGQLLYSWHPEGSPNENQDDLISGFFSALNTAKVGMAEKIKIKWESDTVFTVESVNCSTAAVRSVMTPEELTNAVCPWALFTASIVNKITGKELRFEASEFNEIGAITRLSIIDKPNSN